MEIREERLEQLGNSLVPLLHPLYQVAPVFLNLILDVYGTRTYPIMFSTKAFKFSSLPLEAACTKKNVMLIFTTCIWWPTTVVFYVFLMLYSPLGEKVDIDRKFQRLLLDSLSMLFLPVTLIFWRQSNELTIYLNYIFTRVQKVPSDHTLEESWYFTVARIFKIMQKGKNLEK